MSDVHSQLQDLSPAQRQLVLEKLRQRSAGATADRAPRAHGRIPPAPRGGALPLSFAQQRIWLLDRIEGSGHYVEISGCLLQGPLDVVALERSLAAVIERHEILRTAFPEIDGVPFQRIGPAPSVTLDVEEVSGLPEVHRIARLEGSTAFDLEAGPLYRVRLLRLATDPDTSATHAILLAMHHIVCDKWSAAIFLGELGAFYEGWRHGRRATLPELPFQYADFAAWQRASLTDDAVDEHLGFWRRYLADAPASCDVPTDRPRSPEAGFEGDAEAFAIDPALCAALTALGRRSGATLFMTLQAAFAVLLARYSGRSDLVVGVPVANRDEVSLEGLIGFFVNTLAHRIDVSGEPSFLSLVARVRGSLFDAVAHQDLPFERVVEGLHPQRTPGRHPVFQVMFAFQSVPSGEPRMAGLRLTPLALAPATAKFDLILNVWSAGAGLEGALEYRTALFDAATVRRMKDHFLTLLRSAVAEPLAPVGRLALLDRDERHRQIEEWNDTREPATGSPYVHETFEAHARRAPDAPAIDVGRDTLTYGELDVRANRLAHYLRAHGVGPETLVALLLDRSPDAIVAMLGVLKAGGAFVPLDPDYPAARIAYMLADARPRLVLTHEKHRTTGSASGAEVVCLDARSAAIDACSASPPHARLDPANLAYAIYTSGSTGQPKGVLVQHAALGNLAAAQIRAFHVSDRSRVLQFAPLSFDASISEIVMALCAGAALHLGRRDTLVPGLDLGQALRDRRITHLTLPPSALAAMALAESPGAPDLETLVVAGEACPPALAAQWGHGRRLVNAYGPTESTVCSTMGEYRADDCGRVPIGLPIASGRAYVLDAHSQPVPIGVVGELFVGGLCLARGYLDRPDLTAESFVPDPLGAEPGARLYRTGDLARYLPDGRLEHVGRADRQVKVRGFRVEAGEVEAALLAHPAIAESLVVASADRLVAYLVARTAPPDVRELRPFLADRLPAHLIPSAFVCLDRFPLTPAGKIDRAALPDPGDDGSRTVEDLPRTLLQETLGAAFSQLLSRTRIGIDDNFFDLGGHSLLAARLISRVRDAVGVDVSLREFFHAPTIAGLEAAILAARSQGKRRIPPIRRAAREGDLPLSFAQQRLWFLDQLDHDDAYNTFAALTLTGDVDREALERGVHEVVTRHEILRTTFPAFGGVPVQRIHAEARVRLRVEHAADQAGLESLANAEMRTPFDLSDGPLLRITLVSRGAGRHDLLLAMHHIVADGWSIGILVDELIATYAAFSRGERSPLAPLAVQYADYACWQREWLTDDEFEEQLAYWRRQLDGAPELLDLPTDRPRPAVRSSRGRVITLPLDRDLADRLGALSRASGATLYMTLLAAFASVLRRHSRQDDIVIGASMAGRNAVEVEPLIGFFVNTLALRVDCSGDPPFDEQLRRVRRTALDAYMHQDVPFERIVEELRPARSLGYTPIFQVMFVLQNLPALQAQVDGLRVSPMEMQGVTAKWDLTVFVEESASGIAVSLAYSTDLFDADTIERLASHYESTLRAVALDPAQPTSAIPLMRSDERRRVLDEWNPQPPLFSEDLCLHRWFEAQASRTPERVAVTGSDPGTGRLEVGNPAYSLTYRELDARANQVARLLQQRGVGPDVPVALLFDRSLDMIVAILGVLKAGGAYVPIDPAHPADRRAFMLDDSGARLLLMQGSFLEECRNVAIDVIALDRDAAAIDRQPTGAVDSAARADNLAYVIYTSGSTGQPKGSLITHRTVVRLFESTREQFELGDADVWTLFHSYGFDFSVWEIWGALLHGGRLVIVPYLVSRSPSAFRELLVSEGVTVLSQTPSAFYQLVDAETPSADLPALRLRLVIFGGEGLEMRKLAPWFDRHGDRRPQLVNMYGITETTVHVTSLPLSRAHAAGASVIGRAIPGWRVYVLDERLQPAPIGVPGELFVGGEGVSRGYLGQPALTAQAFVPDPFSDRPGARMYRSGDLARYRADGTLQYLGRIDQQLKIRGFRIEPGDVEAAIAAHPGIRGCVVLPYRSAAGDTRLVAYVATDADQEAGSGARSVGRSDAPLARRLRATVERRVPAYMVPSSFVRVDRLPLTLNGKLDRRALPDPEAMAAEREAERTRPLTGTERRVVGIVSAVLGLADVGADENFFELGGHSLLATQVLARVRDAFAVDVPLIELFKAPTAAGLATAVERARADTTVAVPRAIAPAPIDAPLQMSFAQERLWFLHQLEPENPFYNVALALRLSGSLDVAALRAALQSVVNRHAALRTRFESIDGRPVPRVDTAVVVELATADCSSEPEPSRTASLHRLAVDEARRPFRLDTGPLIRATVVNLDREERALLLTMHHIVSDGWSLGVLVKEVATAYLQATGHAAGPLPELPIQYTDFSAWQRQWLTGDVLDSQLAYWTDRLRGAPAALALPADRTRPARQSFRGSQVRFSVPPEVTRRLRELALASDATLFMTLLAAFAVLLSRYSGQEDVVIGSPIANRTRAEVEPLVGFFVNTLALRADLSGAPTFGELLGRVRQAALEAYAHQDLPFERLVDELRLERDLSVNPLFQVMFALQNAPLRPLELPGLRIAPLDVATTPALFDLVLDMWETGAGLTGLLEFNTDLFDEETAARLAAGFQRLLAAVASPAPLTIGELPILSEAEEAQLLREGTGARRTYPVDRTIDALFADVVSAQPDAVAVVHRGRAVSYGALDAASSRLAAELQRSGVERGAFVGILHERGIELVTAMLAVLKAGAAFLSIDPDYPAERVAFMLADSGVRTIVSRTALEDRFSEAIAASAVRHVVRTDRAGSENVAAGFPGLSEVEGSRPAGPGTTGADRAYMLYTSGSTGRPKGAIVRHNGAINHIYAEFDLLRFHRGSAFLQSAPSSSDISVWQCLGPLLAGGRTVIADFEDVCDAPRLFDLIARERVTLIELVPAVVKDLVEHVRGLPAPARALPDLAWAMITGETVPVPLVNEWLDLYPDVPVVNAYGPTEAADDVCQAVIREPIDPARRSVPIGQPIPNMRMYVLDRDLRMVPHGVVGEICVSGVGVGEGYWGNAERTRAAFAPNPHAVGDEWDRVLYRSGDLGRWLPGGVLECLHRADDQVKLRGFRIELGEIAGAIDRHAGVRSSAVVLRDDEGERRLVAYVAPDLGSASVAARTKAIREEQVALWESLHEQSYGAAPLDRDVTFNTIGWDSNYTDLPLPDAEMREYVERTVERVRATGARDVLEIGCGTGLIMFALLPHCRRYLGTDLSGVAIAQLRDLQQRPDLQARVPGLAAAEFIRARADALAIEPGQFDTAILPSVVQYFPGIDYLVEVIGGLIDRLPADGAIVLGDVRSRPLLEAFWASVRFYKASDRMPVSELAARVQHQVAREQELTIDPAFFVALRRQCSRIASVEVLPKRGRQQNEMTRFRYDVVLRLGSGQPATRQRREPTAWEEWGSGRSSLAVLRDRLRDEKPSRVALRRVANARVADERWLLEALAPDSRHASVGDLRRALGIRQTRQARGEASTGLEPEDLLALGADAGYLVDLSLAAGHPDGSFDVVFTRLDVADALGRPELPDAADPKPWHLYANNPLHEKLAHALTSDLRQSLKAALPNYMVPSDIVVLPSLPLTPAGKIDRRALPPPPAMSAQSRAFVEPATLEERRIAAIWREVLGVDRVGALDNFFELGGHSLKATRVVSRIHRLMNVEIPLREIFTSPTVRELAARVGANVPAGAAAESAAGHVAAGASGGVTACQPIPRLEPADTYPLSHAQRRLWVLAQMEESSAAYNIPAALLLHGDLAVEALASALDALIARHESLRTAFVVVDGEPRQRIEPVSPLSLAVVDLSADPAPEERARRLALEDARRTFDLERAPLIRASLLKLAPRRHVLLAAMHHIVSDELSLGVMVRELMASYRAPGSIGDPLRVQYRDYAAWQHAQLEDGAAARHREYWMQQLSGELPVIDLPADRPRPPVKTYNGRVVSVSFDEQETTALRRLGVMLVPGSGLTTTLYTVLVALVQGLLYRWTGQEDLIVGCPVGGRDHADLEDQIGFYVNMLPLRARVDGDQPFETLLRQVSAVTTEAYEHQAYPFDLLVDELRVHRDVSRSPLFDVVVILQNARDTALSLPGLRIAPFVRGYDMSKFDLQFTFEEIDGTLRLDLVYNPDLFADDTARRFSRHFRELAMRVADEPRQAIGGLDILPRDERERVLQWSAIAEGDGRQANAGPQTIVAMFEAQVVRTPERIAVSMPDLGPAEAGPHASHSPGPAAFDSARARKAGPHVDRGPRVDLTYGDLNVRADRIAARLRLDGAAPGTLVALCLDRSVEMIAGILAVLKAGAGYLPLEPDLPVDRIRFMLRDAGARLLLTTRSQAARLADASDGIVMMCVDDDADPSPAAVPDAPIVFPSDVAYAIYTSGSTGQPKGVSVTHGNVARLFTSTAPWFHFSEDDVWTMFHSYAFDFSVWEMWGALLYGGRLVIVPKDVARSPSAFHALLRGESVTVLSQTPSAFRALADEDAGCDPASLALRLVVFGGEALDPRLLKTWYERHPDDRPRLVNMYGITETTVHVTYRPLSAADAESSGSMIGVPLPDLQLYVLDRVQQPAPIGVAGELHVGGAGVAGGYLNRPALTAERFIANPFTAEPGARLYRSGDLARYTASGDLEYLGRADEQVKVRGFRVEPGEIDAALVDHPDVRHAVVVPDRANGDTRLVAYIVTTGADIDLAELRRHLRERLPEYMVPAAFVRIDALPLTPNGKLDRRALPAAETAATAGTPYVGPRDTLEAQLAAVLRDVLRLERIGIHDNLFDAGAHSLSIVQAHREIRVVLGVDVPVVALFQYPTVAALAQHLSAGSIDAPRSDEVRERAAIQRAARERRRTGRSSRVEPA